MPFLLGSACSEPTETIAKIVPWWNMLQVSYGSTAPALSDQSEYPLFVRTVAPDSSHNPARISLIKFFRWDTITALSQNSDKYSLVNQNHLSFNYCFTFYLNFLKIYFILFIFFFSTRSFI